MCDLSQLSVTKTTKSCNHGVRSRENDYAKGEGGKKTFSRVPSPIKKQGELKKYTLVFFLELLDRVCCIKEAVLIIFFSVKSY